MMRQYFLPVVVSLFLLLPRCSWGSAATLSEVLKSVAISKDFEQLRLYETTPDLYVAASPLIVAAVCSDGIVLVASHTVSGSEKLLRQIYPEISETKEEEEERKEGEIEGESVDNNTTAIITDEIILRDLPPNHGGPHRINRIDGSGTCLLSAGWRGDCDLLTEKIRSLAANEFEVYGKRKWGLPYGRFLAQETSLWMAQISISGSYRPLSCVGLLAACTGQERESGIPGSLWFSDATGAYRVRALAIGGGLAEGRNKGEGKDEDIYLVAQLVNAQLERLDFSTMTARRAATNILNILRGHNTGSSNSGGANPLVPSGCEIEVAIASKQKNLQRLTLSELITDNEVK